MKKQFAFSLIELMIVVAIVAVLAAVALPSYSKYLERGRRVAAQQVLLDTTNREEQYILDARAYSNSFTVLRISPPDDWSCTATTCSNNFYNITFTTWTPAATPPYYELTATAIGAQVGDGNLTLDSAGAKSGTWN